MENTSKKDETNNFGPAATTMEVDGKEIKVGVGIIMTGRDVEEFKLDITQPEKHICIQDGKKAYRKFGGKTIEADAKKMAETAKVRKAQGRKIENVERKSKKEDKSRD